MQCSLHIFCWAKICDGHREKLAPLVAVMRDGSIVDFEQAQSFPIVDPHWMRVGREQEPKLLLTGGEFLLNVLERCDIELDALPVDRIAFFVMDENGLILDPYRTAIASDDSI